MRNKTRPIALILLLAIIGFMLAAVTSCSSLSPSTQAKINSASRNYEQATGITPIQIIGLISQWWADYQAAKAAASIPVLAQPSK
jgi:hypothetical protein